MNSPVRRYVRHDPALGTMPVFQPVHRGNRSKLDISGRWGAAVIRWRGPEVLSISDQSVLFAVLEVAEEQWTEVGALMQVSRTDPIWKLLRHSKAVHRTETLSLTTSFSDLARRSGWNDGGSSIERVKGGLTRMSETTVWVTVDKIVGSSRLLAWDVGDDHSVRLALNWRLASALHDGQYARISMSERAALPNEVAVALHALLCCKVSAGGAWSCGLDKLQAHIWGNIVEGSTLRARHRKMRAALNAIGELAGWGVEWNSNIVRIGRQRRIEAHSPPPIGSNGRAPVASTTPRRFEHKSPSSQEHLLNENPSKGAGLQAMDASVLWSIKG